MPGNVKWKQRSGIGVYQNDILAQDYQTARSVDGGSKVMKELPMVCRGGRVILKSVMICVDRAMRSCNSGSRRTGVVVARTPEGWSLCNHTFLRNAKRDCNGSDEPVDWEGGFGTVNEVDGCWKLGRAAA